MDNSLVIAYEEQSKYVAELESKVSQYEQYAAIRKSKGKAKEVLRRSKHFVKIYKSTSHKLRRDKVLSQAEKALLFDILPFANYETNVIVDEQGIPMNIKQITELCDRNKATIIALVNDLVDKGIVERIKQGKSTYVKLNESYFECGKVVTKV